MISSELLVRRADAVEGEEAVGHDPSVTRELGGATHGTRRFSSSNQF